MSSAIVHELVVKPNGSSVNSTIWLSVSDMGLRESETGLKHFLSCTFEGGSFAQADRSSILNDLVEQSFEVLSDGPWDLAEDLRNAANDSFPGYRFGYAKQISPAAE